MIFRLTFFTKKHWRFYYSYFFPNLIPSTHMISYKTAALSVGAAECMFSLNFTLRISTRRSMTLCDTSVPFLEATIYIFQRSFFFAFRFEVYPTRNTVFPVRRRLLETPKCLSPLAARAVFLPPSPRSHDENRVLSIHSERELHPRISTGT
jgi:hypothetical protein